MIHRYQYLLCIRFNDAAAGPEAFGPECLQLLGVYVFGVLLDGIVIVASPVTPYMGGRICWDLLCWDLVWQCCLLYSPTGCPHLSVRLPARCVGVGGESELYNSKLGLLFLAPNMWIRCNTRSGPSCC